MTRWASLALAATATLLLAAPASAQMKFATGRQGGSQYPVSVALTQIMQAVPGIGTVSLVPGGGASNIVAVDKGMANLGITLSVSALDGIKGRPPYKTPTKNVVQLFALHGFKLAVVVAKDSSIKTFKDLAGKKVNVAPKGFTITEIADHMFKMANLKVDQRYLAVTAAVEQFKDGHLDALFYSPSDRYAPFIDLAQSRDVRILPIPTEILDKMQADDPSFYKTKFPISPDIYKGISTPVDTLGYPNIIIANKDKVTDAQAYAMTKAVAENMEKVAAVEPDLRHFDLKDMALDVGIPIHPGSMKYFKERGWR